MRAVLIWQLARYGATGIISVAVYIGTLWVLVHLASMPRMVSNLVAYGLATLVNYLLNFYWAFRTSRSHAQASWRFLAVAVGGIALNSIFVAVLLELDMTVELAALLFTVLWPIISFLVLRLWALR